MKRKNFLQTIGLSIAAALVPFTSNKLFHISRKYTIRSVLGDIFEKDKILLRRVLMTIPKEYHELSIHVEREWTAIKQVLSIIHAENPREKFFICIRIYDYEFSKRMVKEMDNPENQKAFEKSKELLIRELDNLQTNYI